MSRYVLILTVGGMETSSLTELVGPLSRESCAIANGYDTEVESVK